MRKMVCVYGIDLLSKYKPGYIVSPGYPGSCIDMPWLSLSVSRPKPLCCLGNTLPGASVGDAISQDAVLGICHTFSLGIIMRFTFEVAKHKNWNQT